MAEFYTNVTCLGNNILYRGVDSHGKRIKRKYDYNPSLFVEEKSNFTNSKLKTITGIPVKEIKPGTMSDCRDFIKKYENVDGFKIHGMTKYEYSFISDLFYQKEIPWDIKSIVIAFLDIEVDSSGGFPNIDSANSPITAITLYVNGIYHTFGLKEYVPKTNDIKYYQSDNEYELLEEFIKLWKSISPDIVSGWNINFFDIVYLINRLSVLYGDGYGKILSPWGKIKERSVTLMGKEHSVFEIVGIAILDYLELFRKFHPKGQSQESYKLGDIANFLIGEKKISYDEYGSLHELYENNYEKFIDYNIHDTGLIHRMDQKEGIIALALTLAYDSYCNYEDVFKQTRMWDSIIYNYLRKKDIVIPPNESHHKTPFSGAFVHEPNPGKYKWIASFDLNSLYPHLIMQYNLSPETLIQPGEKLNKILNDFGKNNISVDSLLDPKYDPDILKKHKVTVTPNGQFFSIEKQGFLSEIMEQMYNDRVEYKNKAQEAKKKLQTSSSQEEKEELEKTMSKYNNLQAAKKVCLNSAYGSIGNQFFRYFDIRIAEAVTLSGQLSIRWIFNRLNKFMNDTVGTTNENFIIAADTDSVYLNLERLVDKVFAGRQNNIPVGKIIDFMDKSCEEILQPFINKAYSDLANNVNAFSQKMQMKRDYLGDVAIWTAKKRYIINAYDKEGIRYSQPKIEITGLEAIKSSTPTACRKKIKDTLPIILFKSEKEIKQYVEEFRKEFKKYLPQDIAFPRGVNGIEEYSSKDKSVLYIKGTPIHVKGCIIYNFFLKKHGLDKIYPLIHDGEKIKYLYLKEPNIFLSPVIAFPGIIPKEFKIEEWINYNLQFEKSYLEPIKNITNVIGMNLENNSSASLDEFFA